MRKARNRNVFDTNRSADREVQMSNSVITIQGCWAFVLNQIDIDAELPFAFTEDCSIHKATDEQTQQIKKILSEKVGCSGWCQPTQFYEYDAVRDGASTSLNQLPATEWRYYVVSTCDNGHTNNNLHMASNISAAPLEISALIFYLKAGFGWRSGILQRNFDQFPMPVSHIGKEDLLDIAEVYQSYITFDKEAFPEITRAMNMFDSLSFLQKNSTFHVLGLFAIIEMLITHNPKLEDRGDSITHQMQSKIPLLSRRFQEKLDYPFYFQDGSEKKVWSALYKYRSAMAHGGVSDFASSELRILKDANNADAFLREVVKRLLRHSLKEPQLYRDLRNC